MILTRNNINDLYISNHIALNGLLLRIPPIKWTLGFAYISQNMMADLSFSIKVVKYSCTLCLTEWKKQSSICDVGSNVMFLDVCVFRDRCLWGQCQFNIQRTASSSSHYAGKQIWFLLKGVHFSFQSPITKYLGSLLL